MNKTLKFPEKTRMRKASSLVAVLLLMSLPAAEAAEERWSVAEGPSGDTYGVWTMTLNGDEMSGWAEMFDAAGEPVTYFVSGKREKDEFVLERQSPSDGLKCDYRLKGTPPDNGESLSGGSQCNGRSQIWMAKKIREPEQNSSGEPSPPDMPQ